MNTTATRRRRRRKEKDTKKEMKIKMKVKMNVKMQVNTVDGRNPAPVDTVNIPSFTRVFMHPRWLFGFSSINTMLACW